MWEGHDISYLDVNQEVAFPTIRVILTTCFNLLSDKP